MIINMLADTDNSPILHKCYTNIERWPNKSLEHDEHLIAPCFLADINHALEVFEEWERQSTFPVLGESYRLVKDIWDFHFRLELINYRERLASAINELKSNWVDVLNEAKSRLGVKFQPTDYPDPRRLEGLWKIEFEVDFENPVSTRNILKEYSMFFQPPKQVTIYDAIEYVNEMKEKMAKRAEAEKLGIMKVIAFNGSPRKNWNTAVLLENCLKGAESQGADTELIHLYDLNYKGCISCFACKTRGRKSYGKCKINDDLQSIFKKVEEADVLFFGSPVYLGDVTGEMHSFLERLVFQYLTYTDPPGSLFTRHIKTGFIYTMGVPEDVFNQVGYSHFINLISTLLTGLLQT